MNGAPATEQPAPLAADRRWGRVREVRNGWGFSKPWIFLALKNGRLRGKKVGGVLLIDLDSVRDLIDRSPDWTP